MSFFQNQGKSDVQNPGKSVFQNPGKSVSFNPGKLRFPNPGNLSFQHSMYFCFLTPGKLFSHNMHFNSTVRLGRPDNSDFQHLHLYFEDICNFMKHIVFCII